ncbi:MAG: rhomboid family intramembrane serine protease [Tannerellaceae bacterium]|nr:rhomboid family intramembrane serine protease [Tannerellaceae bacterium]
MGYRVSFGDGGGIPVVTKNLIIVTALCWVASIALPRIGIDPVNFLGLHFPGTKDFWPFQFVTYIFMHDTHSFTHIFFNMFAVYMFGRVLEEMWGAKRFLVFYLVTGIGAALIQELTWLRYVSAFAAEQGTTVEAIIAGDPSLNLMITVGASGSVFGILLAFGMTFPNAPLYIMFIPVPVKAKYMVIGYGVIELILGFSHMQGDVVAHFAHLGGMLFGYFMMLYWKKTDKGYEEYRY